VGVRFSLSIRWAAPALLLLYCALRTATPELIIANEFILYNLIPLAALAATISAPTFNNFRSLAAISLAITSWWVGSLLSSYNAYLNQSSDVKHFIDLGYLLFYPLLFLALQQMHRARGRLARSEFLDALFLLIIIFLALAFIFFERDGYGLLSSTSENYTLTLSLFFDSALLIWIFRILIVDGVDARNILFATGLSLFLAADIAYIWRTSINSYAVGDISDVGWIAGITLIATALWCENVAVKCNRTLHPFTLVTSLLISVALLTLLALGGERISSWLAIPAFLALLLASVRIIMVLRKSHQLNNESSLAHIDELTGLANRRKIIAELSNFSLNEGAFLLLDLDGFKPINDQYGHSVGDQLLQEIAERFTRALPPTAVVARLGGDEFGVIVKGSYEESLEGAYALRASLSYPFTISGQKISVGVSIGYVHNDGRGDLLKRADIAMYQAKNSDERLVQS
jgi:diguanylate cyclase (GGDEF)-like protein